MSDMNFQEDVVNTAVEAVEPTKELKKRLVMIKVLNQETGEFEAKEVFVDSDADAEALEGFAGFVEEESSVLVAELLPVDVA